MREQKKKQRSWKQSLALLFCFVLLLQLTPFGAFAAWSEGTGYDSVTGGSYYLVNEVFGDSISYALEQGSTTINWGAAPPSGAVELDKEDFKIAIAFNVPTYSGLLYEWQAAAIALDDAEADRLQGMIDDGEFIANTDVVVFPLAKGLFLTASLSDGDLFATVHEEGEAPKDIKIGTYKIANTEADIADILDNEIVIVLTFDDGANDVFSTDSEFAAVQAAFARNLFEADFAWSDNVSIGGKGATIRKPAYLVTKTAGTPVLSGGSYEIPWTVTITGDPTTKNNPLSGFVFSDVLEPEQTYVTGSFTVATSSNTGTSTGDATKTPDTSVADTISYTFEAATYTTAAVKFKTSIAISDLTDGVAKASSNEMTFTVPNTATVTPPTGGGEPIDATNEAKMLKCSRKPAKE